MKVLTVTPSYDAMNVTVQHYGTLWEIIIWYVLLKNMNLVRTYVIRESYIIKKTLHITVRT